jgi:hypothetical protein
VVTNTRFSSDAIRYGSCVGLEMLGWDYPHHGNLKEKIDEMKLYPVTCLTTLTDFEKKTVLEKGYVLCRELLEKPSVLNELKIAENRVRGIIFELENLCNHGLQPI